MSDISDLENRISAAMDRIGRGVEALSSAPSGDGGGDAERLERALEDEKMAGAQLEERVKALVQNQDALEKELAATNEAADAVRAEKEEIEAQLDAVKAAKAAAETAKAEAEKKLTDVETKLAEAGEVAAALAPAASDEDIAASREAVNEMAMRLRRMRRMVRNIRENNQRLREAAQKGVTDPNLINASLQSELEALEALRATDLAETDAILAELRPMLVGASAEPAKETAEMGDA
ncbi:hypothetical protein [Shimia abyssi]|nr:hypothetical protein [Shimia abyssi]